MKKLFKKLLIFAFVLAICFSTLLCRPSRASAAEAEADSNLNMQQLAKDFDFITKFYVKDDCLLGIDITNHDFILSSDVIECNYIYEPHMSLPDYTPTYTGFYSFSGNNSIAITVKAGVDIIEFCGYSMSYFDLSKTIYDATGNALYINTTGEISNEGASFSYFAYIGQSEVDRTVVIKSSDFIEPFIFDHLNTYASSTLSITDVATRQQNGEAFYCFVPILSKTICKNSLVTSLHFYLEESIVGDGSGISPCSSVYPTYGQISGYYNGIYDAFFAKARKQDFEGNDRMYPDDITDKDIKKQINTAHKEAYGEFYDYVDGSKTSETVTHYNENNLPFMGNYVGPILDCDAFIKEYLTDNTGRIYNYIDETNYQKLVDSRDNYSYFVETQKDYINEKIASANGASKYNCYEVMYNDAADIAMAKKFLDDYYGEKTYLDKFVISDVEDVKKAYNSLPLSAQEKVNEMLTERNNGLEKTVDETIADYIASTNTNTGNKGDGDGSGNEGTNYDDWHIDFSIWDPSDFWNKLKSALSNPGKFFEEVGKAISKAPAVQTLHLILKIIVAVVVEFLLFKGIKAVVNLIRNR